MSNAFSRRLIAIVFAWLFLPGGSSDSSPPDHRIEPFEEAVDRLLEDLGADSYQTRTRSARRLAALASGNPSAAERILRKLRDNRFPPDDLELYLSKERLLAELESKNDAVRLDRFLHDPTFDHHGIVGWDVFRLFAGDSLDARLVFADAIRQRKTLLNRLVQTDRAAARLPDFENIDRHDAAGWSLLLSIACRQGSKISGEDAIRLNAILRNHGTGPDPDRDHQRRVVAELIASYLENAPMDVRDRIVIGLRFGCDAVVEADCRRILNRPDESPSRIVTALLAASASGLSPREVDQWIDRSLDDTRVSHVWRSMTPPKTTHRTQVRDVALALKLHRSGTDPRERGFDVLVADPLLVFRPYSLGFESDEKRSRWHDGRGD